MICADKFDINEAHSRKVAYHDQHAIRKWCENVKPITQGVRMYNSKSCPAAIYLTSDLELAYWT